MAQRKSITMGSLKWYGCPCFPCFPIDSSLMEAAWGAGPIALGDLVAVHGHQSRPELNGCFAEVLTWDRKSKKFQVCFEGTKETLTIKPGNLSSRPLEIRPGKPHIWTSASLSECRSFLLCVSRTRLGGGPRRKICEFLLRQCKGLATLGHGRSRGGHPLAALIRIWYVLGAQSYLSEHPSELAKAISNVFRDLDHFQENQVVSLEPVLELLRQDPLMEDVAPGETADFFHLGLSVARSLEVGSPHLNDIIDTMIDFKVVTRITMLSCCGGVRTARSELALTLRPENAPLDRLISELCTRKRFEVQGGALTCPHCNAENVDAVTETFIPCRPTLCIEVERAKFVPPGIIFVDDPIGEFSEALSLPAKVFENGELANFVFAGVLLYNQDPEFATVGYSTVIRSNDGSLWWHRCTGIGHPVTGHLVESPWGASSTMAIAKEVSWLNLRTEELSGEVFRFCLQMVVG